MPSEEDTRERLTRLETSLEHQSQTLDSVNETLKVMQRTLILNEGNRRKIDSLREDHSDLDSYVRSRWYVAVAITSAIAAAVSIYFNVTLPF